MPNNDMKNIVVLKSLPSNLIDEAIVILKSKKLARKIEINEKKSVDRFEKNKKKDDYLIKEAETVISNYIAKIENSNKIKSSDINIETKYRKIKIYSIIISLILFICIIKIIF